jgi:hypothetical protein
MEEINNDITVKDFELAVEVTFDDLNTQDEVETESDVVLEVEPLDEIELSEAPKPNDDELLLLEDQPFSWENFDWSNYALSDMPEASFSWEVVGQLSNPKEVWEASQQYHFTNWDALSYDIDISNFKLGYITEADLQEALAKQQDPTSYHGTDYDLGVPVQPDIQYDFIG